MRVRILLTVFVLLGVATLPARASDLDERDFDQASIDALTVKASMAAPKEQCFLYAELLHQMTEVSLRQYSQGEVGKASAMLKQVQQLAHRIHMTVADDNKKLKNAEILLRHTAFRLKEMLHNSSSEDRPLVSDTLAQVSQAQTDAMMQVFRK